MRMFYQPVNKISQIITYNNFLYRKMFNLALNTDFV